ncbi:MAG: SAM-dependent DNA methyltransferase, partial [Candidatus Tectomicrobia bacterium]|nr:SAM-dependent DNA methyltransferase [Candidatus Tectomicrobia bacterium]
MDWQAQDQLIKGNTKDIRSAIQQAALDSLGSEDTFRTKVSHILNNFCQSADIRFETRENHTLASGKKPDTLFSRLIIEYKAPNVLRSFADAPQNQKAIKQTQDYIEKVSKEEKRDIKKMAGVILDGHYLIFIKRLEKGWQEDGPHAVNNYSIERFLRYLLSLDSGVALTPEQLVQDFRIEQPRAQGIIHSFYGYLTNNEDPLVARLFEQWKVFFSSAIEYKEAFSSPKLKQLKDYAHRAGVDIQQQAHAEAFFFAVHTYFALLAKFIAWQALSRYFAGKSGAPLFSRLSSLSSDELKRELNKMELGGTFRDMAHIRNLLEGDFFRWYLNAWNEPIDKSLREIINKLSYYDPTTLAVEPKVPRDLLKKLYHKLMPRDIRHNLGEYYTPDWLAQRLLNQVDIGFFKEPPDLGYLREKLLKRRFLDPACGSGTFLALIINRIREAGKQLLIPENAVLDAILNNVVGIDLNPLAVIAARTTYV